MDLITGVSNWTYFFYGLLALATLTMIYWLLFIRGWHPRYADDNHIGEIDLPDDTRQIPVVSESFEVPEQDQKYLLPIVVAVLKKLAFTKRMYPTNAMLIEHLAEALGEAAKSFTPRKNNSEPPEQKNEAWLWIAAFSIRLYDEGTPHNCNQAREAFVTESKLASRRLTQWANRMKNDIRKQVREGTVGSQNVKNVTEHIETVGQTPFTADEIEDMKRSFDDPDDTKFMRIVRKHRKDKD